MSIETSQTRPPDLNNPAKYTKFTGVPVLDVHIRHHKDDNGTVRTSYLDKKQLSVITENTNKRITEKGEIPAIRLGHLIRPTKENPHVDEWRQPPKVGYMSNLRVGLHNNRPTTLVDMHIENEVELPDGKKLTATEILKRFDRRSPEVFRKMDPNGYIDALALLVIPSERDLGLTTNYSKDEDIEFFECETCGENMQNDASLTPPAGPEKPPPSRPDVPASGPDPAQSAEGVARRAAVRQLAEELVDAIAAHKGFHGAMAQALTPAISEKVIADVKALIEMNAVDEQNDKQVQSMTAPQPSSFGSSPDQSPAPAGQPAPEVKPPAVSPPPPSRDERENFQAGTPSGTNTFVPSDNNNNKNKETEHMSKENQFDDLIARIGVLTAQNELLAKNNTDLQGRLGALEAFNKDQARVNRINGRKNQLKSLEDAGYMLDVDSELEQFSKIDEFSTEVADEMFSKRVDTIKTSYIRNMNGAPYIETARSFREVGKPGDSQNTITEEDVREGRVEHFRQSNPELCAIRPNEDPNAYGNRIVKLFIDNKNK